MNGHITGRRSLRVALAGVALAALLASCTQQPTPAPAPAATAVPTIPLRATSGNATASGVIAPAREASLGFAAAGRVQAVAVSEGDTVEAGALLLTLDQSQAQAAVAQAQSALMQANAQLGGLQEGARPQELAAARARLEAAQARLTQVTEGAADEDIAAAQAALAAAQAAQQDLFRGPSEQDRIAAQAALANANAALQQAQAAYDRVAGNSDIGLRPESRQLQEATNNQTAAQARYDALFAAPDAAAVAAARAQVQQAQAALDKLRAPASPGQIAEAEAQVHSAQADLDLLAAGAREQDITAAAASVAEAEAALSLAKSNLASTELRAPFAGTITDLAVGQGEMVVPGQAVVTLADLNSLQVETTDLSERDVARVAVGQPVNVYVEALNTDIAGAVQRIASQANIVGGDVVYTVVVSLDEQPAGLRWGMSADVDIAPE